jgi:hypothetical protein
LSRASWAGQLYQTRTKCGQLLSKEELRRDLVKCKLDRCSSNGSKPKEEENATLASKGQQEQQKKKKDVSKIKWFKCGEFSHYVT